MSRRPAATLMEVLISIFIMAIGLLAILALFPLGAIRMAEAIQSDRSAHLAQNAAALAETLDLRNDPAVTGASLSPGGNAAVPRAPVSGGPGYPVYIDAIGRLGNGGNWVGTTQAIRRVTPGIANTAQQAIRWFSLLDDIRFGPIGQPVVAGQVDRESNLSYAVMYRRPMKDSGAVAEVAVVVYARRPIAASNTETEFLNTPLTPVTFNTLTNTIQITNQAGRPAPKLTAGTWIMDGTLVDQRAGLQNARPTAYSYFYRVVSVTQLAANKWEIEVGTPLRGWNPGWTAAQMATQGVTPRVLIMDNVIEVFERGSGWPQ